MFLSRTPAKRASDVMLILAAGGIEDGSDHRLPDEYEVRKKEVTEDDKPEVNESSEDLRKEARLGIGLSKD